MEKIHTEYLYTKDDRDSLQWIHYFVDKYPTEDGYRIETFMSPKFVRVTVYKMGLSLKGE